MTVPEGWRIVDCESEFYLESGSRPKGGATTDSSGVLSLGGEHVNQTTGRVEFEPRKYIPQSYFRTIKRGRLRELDILLNKDGANTGKIGLTRAIPEAEAAVNEHLFIIRAKKFYCI